MLKPTDISKSVLKFGHKSWLVTSSLWIGRRRRQTDIAVKKHYFKEKEDL
jgi:hypothetical protein